MSVAALTWALNQPVTNSCHKFVLVVLANYADETSCCYPSVACLCHDTCQDRKTILNGLKALRENGFIIDTGVRVGRTGSVVVYQLAKAQAVPKTEPLQAVPKTELVPNTVSLEAVPKTDSSSPVYPISSPVYPSKQSQKRDTDTKGHERVHERDTKGSSALPDLPIDLQTPITVKAWADFVEHRKLIKKPMTHLAAERVFGRLVEWGERKWVQSVDESIERGWSGIFPPKVMKPDPDVYRPPKCF